MAIHATFKNGKTGELKQVKVGWSWTLLFFSSFFGLPLFLRRLHVWGAIELALWIVYVIGLALPNDVLVSGIFLIQLGLSIWLAIKGNEMTAKNYLENGWVFADADNDATKVARLNWGLST